MRAYLCEWQVHADQVVAHDGDAAHPDVLETAWRLGSLLAEGGTPASDADAAVALLRDTAARQAAALGGGHPRTLRTRVSLGEALLALAAARGGGARRGGSGGGDGDGVGVSDRSRGEAAAAVDEAAGLFAACEAAQRAALGAGHHDLLRTSALAAAHPRRS